MMYILSHTSTGILTLSVNNRCYTYFDVNPYQFKKIRRLVKLGNVGMVMNALRPYARTDLFKKEVT